MRRLLVAGLLVFLTVVSGIVGIIAADWPFWSRVARIPSDTGEWPDSFYQPAKPIAGAPASFFPQAAPEALTLDPAALERASVWAEANNSVALLVLHRGVVQFERYYGDMTQDKLFSGRAMTRSMLGMLVGIALAEGKIASLDAPVSTWLDEWRDDPRGSITLRQLLWNTSGLEEVPLAPPPRGTGVLGGIAPLAALVTSKNSRLSLGSDFAGAALAFAAEHEPGVRFNFSNANAQLVGVVLERATREPFESYVNSRLWAKLGAGRADFYLDRENGMPAVYCCFRATPRDFLRLGALLVSDGAVGTEQVLPRGWVQQMATGSSANPLYGMQLWAGRASAGTREYTPGSGRGVEHGEAYVSDDVIWMEGGGGRTLWAIPSQQLVILRLGRQSKTWDASYLPNTLARAVRN